MSAPYRTPGEREAEAGVKPLYVVNLPHALALWAATFAQAFVFAWCSDRGVVAFGSAIGLVWFLLCGAFMLVAVIYTISWATRGMP